MYVWYCSNPDMIQLLCLFTPFWNFERRIIVIFLIAFMAAAFATER